MHAQDATAPAPPLIDIGANLTHESFAADLNAVLDRAWQAGLTAIVVTGSDAHSSEAAAALARAHPGRLYATAGLHPHHAADWSETMAAMMRRLVAAQPALVALGECGLDYFRDLAPRPQQRIAFEAQLSLAADLGKPVFLHQRDAHQDFLAMLRAYRPHLPAVVVHCFTDTRAALEDYLALDCHIGITGWVCDERRGRPLLDTVGLIPDNRLMLETDAPYLLPRNAPRQRDRRNEPGLLPYVAQAVAAARGVGVDWLAAATSANARAFFALPSGA